MSLPLQNESAADSAFRAQEEHKASQPLPPRDSGKDAWSLLAAVSAILMVTWGFGSSSGVFREYYFAHEPFAGNQLVAAIGVMIVGILQVMSPFVLRYLSGRSEKRKVLMWSGMFLVIASSLGAAFSTTAPQLIMTQGLLYGVGSGLLFAPSVSYIDEWFLERRGLANGIFFGSNNIAAAAFSPVFAILLKRFGPRAVMIAWAIFAGVIIAMAIIVVKPRVSKHHPTDVNFSWLSFRKPLFLLFSLSMTLQGLANFLPAAYLPSYATDLGFSSAKGALLITFLSLAGMIGQSLLGALTDIVGALLPLLLSTVVSAFAVLVIWGLGRSYWTLVVLAILFGAFSFSFVVLRSHMAVAIVGDLNHPNEELVISGALMCIRGIAAVTSGYIGAAIVSTTEGNDIQPTYGAGKWRPLVIALGTLMFGATIGAIGFLKRERRVLLIRQRDQKMVSPEK